MKKKRYRPSSVHTPDKEYTVYKGDDILVSGSLEECAKTLNIQVDTLKYYTTPSHRARHAKAKNPEKNLIVEITDDDD